MQKNFYMKKTAFLVFLKKKNYKLYKMMSTRLKTLKY